MKKVKLYLGGEEIDENKMLPNDFADIVRSFIKDLIGGRK